MILICSFSEFVLVPHLGMGSFNQSLHSLNFSVVTVKDTTYRIFGHCDVPKVPYLVPNFSIQFGAVHKVCHAPMGEGV